LWSQADGERRDGVDTGERKTGAVAANDRR
jgi:hypothetical protein